MANKTAQEMGVLTKLRELGPSAVGGRILERFNNEFSEVMDELRSTDESSREKAKELQYLLEVSEDNFKKREYLIAAFDLSKYFTTLEMVVNSLKEFVNEIELKHYDFLLQSMDESHKQEFEELSKKFAIANMGLRKQAGLLDWISDFGDSDRTKAMKQWEKRFPNFKPLKDLKNETRRMVLTTRSMHKKMLSTFKILGMARVKRQVDQYTMEIKKFVDKYNAFATDFKSYFNNTVKPVARLFDTVKSKYAPKNHEIPTPVEESMPVETSLESEESEFVDGPQGPTANHVSHMYTHPGNTEPVETYSKPVVKEPETPKLVSKVEVTPEVKTVEVKENKTLKEPPGELEPGRVRKKKTIKANLHAEFLTKIASMTDVKEICKEVLAYSESIDESSPEASLKLLAIAEGYLE